MLFDQDLAYAPYTKEIENVFASSRFQPPLFPLTKFEQLIEDTNPTSLRDEDVRRFLAAEYTSRGKKEFEKLLPQAYKNALKRQRTLLPKIEAPKIKNPFSDVFTKLQSFSEEEYLLFLLVIIFLGISIVS